ncbi:MAG: YfhO family protein, partial [Chloroflexi bacterium]|nr:YfhO family protein [Chloroflexota bacterium]
PLSPDPPRLAQWHDELRALGWRLLLAARVVFGRLTFLAWALAVVPLTGLAIAAVQLLPLYELGTFSRRAGGVDYAMASSQAQTVYNLVTLIFPYFFRDASNVNWGLWTQWETRLYVGILPLILGVVAVFLVRSRVVFFFAIVGLVSFLIGLADSSPIKLLSLISTLPGYNLVRAPGRYAYLWTLANAVLAAYAANWLSNPVVGHSRFRFFRERWKPDSFLWRFPSLVVFALLAVGAAELPFAVLRASEYVASHKTDILNLIQQNYLSLPRMLRPTEYALTPGRIYDALAYSFSFDNPSTRYGLNMVVASAALLVVGCCMSKAKWLWQIAVIALAAGDLIMVGWQFHPTIQINQLSSTSPAAGFLKDQPGLFRVFSRLGTATDPNLLLPAGVAEASGYSSLQFGRQARFAALMESYDNQLMDMMNVRYLVTGNRYVPTPSYETVAFNPNQPLLAGKYGNRAATVSFSFPPIRTDRIRVLSHLQNSIDIPQGTPVGQITLIDDQNRRYTSTLVAGVHTAEWAYDRPDVILNVKHKKPAKVAYTWPASGAPNNLYYAELLLDRAVTVQRAEVSPISSQAEIRVFGVTLVEFMTWRIQPLTRNDTDRLKTAYRDSQVLIKENTKVLPRAFLVQDVRMVTNPDRILNEMTMEPFDASKSVILEDNDPVIDEFIAQKQAAPPPAIAGDVTIDAYGSESVRITANAAADSFLVLSDTYYPGWHALLDGAEVTVYRANYLFRAIKVPKGTHSIQFYYAPRSFQLGLFLTLLATSIVLAAWVGLRLAWLVNLARSILPLARGLSARARSLAGVRIRALFPPRQTLTDRVAEVNQPPDGPVS